MRARKLPLPLLLLLSAAMPTLLPRLASAGWDGTQEVRLGDRIAAEFAPADANHHRYSFFAVKDTVLTVKAKGAAGLVLGFELYDVTESAVDMGAAVTATGIKAFRIPSSGAFALEVSAEAGSGVYLLTMSGKFPKAVAGQATLSGTTPAATFTFGALGGSVIGASAKPASGSAAASVVIKTLTYPGGTVTVTQGATVANLSLPVDSGFYRLGLGGTAAGAVDVAIKVKAPKVVKRAWSFGIVEIPAGTAVQVRKDWAGSPHAEAGSEAFRHWDADGSITTSCAKCHSSGGYQDWVGCDGTAFEVVNNAAPLGTTVDCEACHNTGTVGLTTCLFPSGLRVDALGDESRCMQCHQGRESGVSMDTMITMSGLGEDAIATGSVPSGQPGATDRLSFRNVHYLAAAATLYGREAQGGYQYEGKLYNGRVQHVADYDTCIECHDQHTTELRLTECAQCHTGATTYAALQNIRMERSVADYDGDGNDTEGMAGEVSGMAGALYAAMQAYGTNQAHPILFNGASYPYWFSDANGNGTLDTGEGSYTFWTPRLVKAAYNYQFFAKEPGAYAHNPRYVMQLLYDSTESLNEAVPVTGFSDLVRGDSGHFDATSMAFRDWDAAEGDSDGLVNANCSQCHSTEGFRNYVYNLSSSTELSVVPAAAGQEGMLCESCHQSGVAAFSQETPPLRNVPYVWFASTKVSGTKKLTNSTTSPDPSFVCMTCHQGRQSKQTIDDYILTQNTAPKPSSASFQNIHYLPAGGTLYGKDAQVGYEYAGRTYEARFTHKDGAAFGPTNGFQCTYCHLTDHTFLPQLNSTCQACHTEAGTDIEAIRKNRAVDYDGDGSTTEHLADEVHAFDDALYAAIRAYSATAFGATKRIYYDGSSHPYWFYDTDGNGIKDSRGEDVGTPGHPEWADNGSLNTEDANGNGTLDAGEDTDLDGNLDKEDLDGDKVFDSDWAQYPFWKDDTQNAVVAAQGRMMKAAHNYQFSHKEPGAWAHNTKYMLQLLYDAIDDVNNGTLDSDVPLFTRP